MAEPVDVVEELTPSVPPSARLLVVEDDLLQARSLAFIFRQEGYAVEVSSTGSDALARARTAPALDLIVLDVALPDLSGVEVARRLRVGSAVPILMLTARREESDKIVGLDAGADDYLTKPFSTGELLARVRALLRRAAAVRGPRTAPVFVVGPLRIEVETRRLTKDGRAVHLSAREFAILRVLAEAEGSVVERQELFAQVWGPSFFGDEGALDVYVRTIRRKIEPDPTQPTYLRTVRGVGYLLGEDRPMGDGGSS
jgi:DNA-binding response OmpR family regulator